MLQYVQRLCTGNSRSLTWRSFCVKIVVVTTLYFHHELAHSAFSSTDNALGVDISMLKHITTLSISHDCKDMANNCMCLCTNTGRYNFYDPKLGIILQQSSHIGSLKGNRMSYHESRNVHVKHCCFVCCVPPH